MSYHDLNPIEHGVNWSALKVLLTHSPLHFYNQFMLGVVKDPSAAMIFGRLTHCAVLEQPMLNKEFAVKPEPPSDRPTYFRTKEGKAEMELWKSRNSGRDIVKAEEMDKAMAMVSALHVKDRSRFWLWEAEGENEQDYQWQVAQLAFYADGEKADGAVIVAQETKEPFDSAVYVLSTDLIDDGRRVYAEALRRFADCALNYAVESGETAYAAWPGLKGQQELTPGDLGGWSGRTF